MIYIDLCNLDENLSSACDAEFERKMNESDGKRCFLHINSLFDIDLTIPSIGSQVILGYFANCGCPISSMRFAASLFPFNFEQKPWPVMSEQAAQSYIFEAIETAINLKYDENSFQIVESFQSTKEFQIIMLIAEEILKRTIVSRSVCPEIQSYIRDAVQPLRMIADERVQ